MTNNILALARSYIKPLNAISTTEFARGLGLLFTSNKEKRVKGAYKGRKHSKVTTVVVFCIELKGYYLRGSESPSF